MPSPTPADNSFVTPSKTVDFPGENPEETDTTVDENVAAALPPVVDDKFTKPEALIITKLVFNKEHPTKPMFDALQTFFDHIGVEKPSDLEGQDVDDLIIHGEDALPDGGPIRGVITGRLKKFLIYASAPSAVIDPSLTYQKIVKFSIDQAKQNMPTTPIDLTKAIGERQGMKFRCPEVEPFSGESTVYWPWTSKVALEFGQSGIELALTDEKFHEQSTWHKDASSQGFYAIAKALNDGTASHIADEVKEKKGQTVAYDLYQRLLETYNSPEDQAHFVMYAIDELTSIKLTHNVTVPDFISNWKSITTRLRKSNQSLATSRELLRVFLLKAIVSDTYSDMRRYIVKYPLASIDEYLEQLRSHSKTQALIDEDSPVLDDGAVVARRGATDKSYKKRTGARFDKDYSKEYPKWHIPQFPIGWDKSFPNGLFKTMLNWREKCHGTNLQPSKIDRDFGLKPKYIGVKRKDRRGATGDGNDGDDGSPDAQPNKNGKQWLIQSYYKKLRTDRRGRTSQANVTITEW
jgi:hypothetical protein